MRSVSLGYAAGVVVRVIGLVIIDIGRGGGSALVTATVSRGDVGANGMVAVSSRCWQRRCWPTWRTNILHWSHYVSVDFMVWTHKQITTIYTIISKAVWDPTQWSCGVRGVRDQRDQRWCWEGRILPIRWRVCNDQPTYCNPSAGPSVRFSHFWTAHH